MNFKERLGRRRSPSATDRRSRNRLGSKSYSSLRCTNAIKKTICSAPIKTRVRSCRRKHSRLRGKLSMNRQLSSGLKRSKTHCRECSKNRISDAS